MRALISENTHSDTFQASQLTLNFLLLSFPFLPSSVRFLPLKRLHDPPCSPQVNAFLITRLSKDLPIEQCPCYSLLHRWSMRRFHLEIGFASIPYRCGPDENCPDTRKMHVNVILLQTERNLAYAVNPNTGLIPPASLPVRN